MNPSGSQLVHDFCDTRVSPLRASSARARRPRHKRSRRGFFWADVAIGLAVIGVIAVLLVSAVGRQNQAAARLSDARAATRIAEDALTALQTGIAAPADPEANVQVRRTPARDVTGMEWAEINVVYRGRTMSLSGLVPAEAGRP